MGYHTVGVLKHQYTKILRMANGNSLFMSIDVNDRDHFKQSHDDQAYSAGEGVEHL